MPIILDDLQQNVSKKVQVFSPKFFDSKLTGSGKRMGVLNENRNPAAIPASQTTISENISVKKRKYTNNGTETTIIPVNILSADGWSHMEKLKRPVLGDMKKIGFYLNDQSHLPADIYIYLQPHNIVMEETRLTQTPGSKGPSLSKKCTPSYQLFLFIAGNMAIEEHDQHDTVKITAHAAVNPVNYPAGVAGNTFWYDFTCNPAVEIESVVADLRADGAIINDNDVADYIQKYSLFDGMCKRSEEWQTTIHEFLEQFFQNVAAQWQTGPMIKNETAYTLRRIEDYPVPLDLYRKIYHSILQTFTPSDATELCKQNLNLLLSDTLNSLEQNKSVLNTVPIPNPNIPVPMSACKFSPEQQRAITSHDPLVLVQAGAGTGKSTVILGRIDWMIASGINPADITVLSFTNAAADHITEKNPNIHSMTIARMIHSIYTLNFPGHELSTLDTILNSVDIYFANTDTIVRFKDLCKAIIKNDADGYTRMNNFVERHYDEVIQILDTIGQTSLELEIIICYQQIENFQEPPEVQSKYLIIDEVQDNSIFEFIYTLKYVDKHKESLFIVGDCSQTLYEFRASNPKALNVLEGSGVFTAFQLQVNYRSNQEILDFANVALANIEANQYANIQLRANSLQQVTEQSFTDKVKFKYYRLNKINDFDDYLPTIFANDLRPYIDGCLARGQQVAFLAFTRKNVYRIQSMLQSMYPGRQIANLVPEKMHNTTIFSQFVKNYWDEVKFMPTENIADIITRCVIDRLAYLVYNSDKMQGIAMRLLDGWVGQDGAAITSWQQQYVNGQLTEDVFIDNVKRSMLQYEIRNNSIRQALLSMKNQETKANQNAQSADFVISTIHSAKGLEFDNTIVIYRNDNDIPEDKKRMYYVAFTRAMQSEFIVAYDVTSNPKIEADYKTIVENLHRIAPIGSTNGTAIANAKAVLAAQKAGQIIDAIDGIQNCNAIIGPKPHSNTVAYLRANPDLEDFMSLTMSQAYSKVYDQAAIAKAAEAVLTQAETRLDLKAQAEQEQAEIESTQPEEAAS